MLDSYKKSRENTHLKRNVVPYFNTIDTPDQEARCFSNGPIKNEERSKQKPPPSQNVLSPFAPRDNKESSN